MELIWQGAPFNFLFLENKYSNIDNAKFIIVPVPFDSTVFSNPGCRDGPLEIIKASRDLEYYDLETDSEPYIHGIHTINPIEVNRGNVEDTIQRINETISEIVKHSKIPIIIGGEHSITIGATDAMDDDTVVIVFDAHADLRWGLEGCRYSHACTVRRILDKKKVFLIGVRAVDKEEKAFADQEPRLNLIFSHELNDKKIKDLIDSVSKKKVYISIDLDVLDPSVAPGVTTPIPDGLSYKELTNILKKICNNCNICGFCVTECNPVIERKITPFIAANLIYKMMAYITERP